MQVFHVEIGDGEPPARSVTPTRGISGPIPLLDFPVPGTGWSAPGHRTRS
jgi:hypothetical protein